MSNLKHTPAPWKVVETDKERKNEANPFDVMANDHQCIAHITNWSPEANAKLIASAPELLETLVEIKSKLDKITINGNFTTEENEVYELTINAIKKATE